MFAIMIRSLVHDARSVRRGDRDRRDEVGFARPNAADADDVAGFHVAGELGLHVRRRVTEDRRLCLAVHDKAVDLAVRVEQKAFDGAFHFRQAIGINPVHVVLLWSVASEIRCRTQPRGGAGGGGGGGPKRSGPPLGPSLGPRGGRGPSSSVIWPGEAPIACTSTTLPSAVSSSSPRTETICPGCSQSAKRSASGGGKRSWVPSSSSAPFTSPRLPCSAVTIRPLKACCMPPRSGPRGGPLSATLLPVATLVTEAASTNGMARARRPRIETSSPGRIA